jgi:hypothetical protein
VNRIVFAAALLAAPLAARADIGIRLGGEAGIATHANGSTSAITDNWPLSADLMLSYWTPGSVVSLDLEVAEQFQASAPAGQDSRSGTVLRPGIRLSPPVFPLYFRAAIPIVVEAPANSGLSSGTYALRLGTGFNIPLVLFKIFVELDADFALGGGNPSPDAFSAWNLQLASGIDFRF